MSNKKLGNDFESKFCEILFENGFWTHNLTQNASGQPADVIAARNGKTYLIDCKVCSSKGFALSRMEENQDLSMDLWSECGNGVGWFALLLGERIYMIPHVMLKALQQYKSILSEFEITEYGFLLERWIEKCK